MAWFCRIIKSYKKSKYTSEGNGKMETSRIQGVGGMEKKKVNKRSSDYVESIQHDRVIS